MIKLGKLTDYAVVLLVQLARESEGTSCSASQLAGRTGLPEPTVAKVLKKLSQEKIIESARGATGGYRLSQQPAEVSVCSVIEAMDGPIAIASCVDTSCVAETQCPAKGKWTPVNDAIRAALMAVTLADMADAGGGCGTRFTELFKITGEGLRAHIK